MVAVRFDPGEMTARLMLSKPVATPDGQGGVALAFEDMTSVWARIVPHGADVEERAGADLVSVTHRIWIRWRDDVGAGMRLAKGTRHFAVKSAHDPDESGRYLVLSCAEDGA